MSAHAEFLQEYVRRLDERLGSRVDALASGAPQNIEEYRTIVGEIRALRFAHEQIEAATKHVEERTRR